jgi:hypothetical protein
MADTEANIEEGPKAFVQRPQYMGAHRQEALADDPEPTDEEVIDAELAADDETLAPEEKTFKKRYGDLRRHNQGQVKSLEKALAEKEAELNALQAEKFKPVKTDEEVEAFAESNPEAFDIIKTVSGKQVSSEMEELNSLKAKLEDERAELQHEKAAAIISAKHPDWDDIKESDAFHDWAETQSKLVQDGIYANSDDGALAAQIVSLYKMEADLPKTDSSAKRSKLKEDASKLVSNNGKRGAPSGKDGSKRIYKNSEIDVMSLTEFDRLEEDILLAKQEGRIILDE